MIIFLSDGRLGNQLFQYAFLNTIAKENEKIVVSGFEDLKEVFEISGIVNFNKKNRWIRAFLYRVIKPILTFLSDKKIISSISIKHEKILKIYRSETTTYKKKQGFFSSLTFVKLGYFQSEEFFKNEIKNNLKIKDLYMDKAKDFLNIIPKDAHKVFVHIRRGDYKDYTVYGKSTLLPMSYYKEQIQWFLNNREKCFFIFLSDEASYIEKEFNYIENKLVSINNHYGTDLAIMTLCNNAILSPSSFGWWGSYLMKDRDVVFVPKYWLGFNSNIEFGTNTSNCPSFSTKVLIND